MSDANVPAWIGVPEVSDFLTLFQRAGTHFESGRYGEAREDYLRAIGAEPNHVDVFRAILKVELLEEMAASPGWYGERRPRAHALCLLGSVSESAGERPHAHYAFFGKTAYDAFQTAYYLQDLFRLRRYDRLVQPTFLLLHLAMKAVAATRVEFLELGSTLFAAYEKFANCERFLDSISAGTGDGSARSAGHEDRAVADGRVDFIGVELSDWLREVSRLVHPDVPIRLYPSHAHVPPSALPRFSFSLGVGNYAFETTAALARWLAQSRLAVLRERFTLGRDFTWEILGKRFTCFSLPELAEAVARLGRKVSLLSFGEAPPFLQPSDPVPTPDSVFLDAYVAVHDLSQEEMERIAHSITAYRLETMMLTFNTNPSFRIGADILARSLDAIHAAEWTRNYADASGQPRAAGSAPSDPCFDFTSEILVNGLAAHVDALMRAYEG